MSAIESARTQRINQIANGMDGLDQTFAVMIRNALEANDLEHQVRIERARKSVAEKARAVEVLLDEARSADQDEWERLEGDLDGAWIEYREAVDRIRLEMERASELS